MGKQLTRSANSKFWDDEFDVYFQNVRVNSCDLEDDPCELQFSSSATVDTVWADFRFIGGSQSIAEAT